VNQIHRRSWSWRICEQHRQHLHLDYIRSRSDSFLRINYRSRSQRPIHLHELDVFFLCSSLMTCLSSPNPCFSERVFVHNDYLYSSLSEVIHPLSFFSLVIIIFSFGVPCTHLSRVRVFHNCSNFDHGLKISFHHMILTLSFFLCFYSCRIC
jgi:hypothetical protein